VTAYSESFDVVTVEGVFAPGAIDIRKLEASRGPARIHVAGHYDYAKDDRKNGKARFETTGTNLSLSQWQFAQEFRRGMDGQVEWKATGSFDIDNAFPRLNAVEGRVEVKDVRVNDQSLGQIDLTARTVGNRIDAEATGDLRGVTIKGSGEWQLTADAPGL